MKYFFIKLSTVANGIFIWSQFTFAQNVGVNTDGSSPTELLHVKSTAASQNHLLIQHTLGAQELALRLLNSGTASADWKLYVPASSSNLRLYNTADRVTFLSTGQVGINQVASTSYFLGVTNASTTAGDAAIRGTSTGNGIVYGVFGTITSTTAQAAGVRGNATANAAVYGVFGDIPATTTTANAAGVRGYAAGGAGDVYGVFGESNATGASSAGVRGLATNSNGTGLLGQATGAGTSYGVLGTATGVATTNYGGYFSASGAATNYGLYVNSGTTRLVPLASGVNGAILRTNSSGDLVITNFSGTATDVLLGNGTFGAVPGTIRWDQIQAPTANLSLAHASYTTAFTFNSVTASNAFSLSSTSLTSGNLLSLTSSNAAATGKALSATSNTTTADNATIYGAATGNARVYGVLGTVTATTDDVSGVRGYASGATGLTNGVWGEAASSAGAGVYGLGTNVTGNGVVGINSAAAGANIGSGVYGSTNQDWNGSGIWGDANNINGVGVYGQISAASNTSFGTGVWGFSNQTNGIGVEGDVSASGVGGAAVGGYFTSNQSAGSGVWGENTAAAGAGIGFGGYFTNLQTGGSGVAGSIGTSSYFAGVAVSGIAVSTLAGGVGVYGDCSNGTGYGVRGQNLGAGATAGFGGGFVSYKTGGAGAFGSLGTNSYYAGAGVSGIAVNTLAGGEGVHGGCDNATGTGVLGESAGTTGMGVAGLASGATASIGVYGQNTAGTASSWAVYGFRNNNVSGTGYGIGVTRIAVVGRNDWGNSWNFGVGGYRFDDAVNRSGGVIGVASTAAAPATWGILGYRNSGGTYNGVYSTSVFASGGGFLSSSDIQGTGAASYGGIIGSWTRGEVMGHISAGELFASYNLGNAYTSGYSAEVITVKNKRVAAYTLTSIDIKVYDDGTGKLINGKARINFEQAFTELVGDNKPVVTITPMGQCNGIYISNVDSKGFDVVELNNGNSNVEFSYITISKRIDAANKPELPEVLSRTDFDDKMKGVMFNESNTEQNALPIWWDGTKVRFDTPPQPANEEKKITDVTLMNGLSSPATNSVAQGKPSNSELINKKREKTEKKKIGCKEKLIEK